MVEEGSFAAAAASLGRTQPTVSKEVAALERHAHTPLLERSRSGTRPTPAGLRLVESARAVLEASANLERDTASLATPGAETLTIACSPSVTNILLPTLLQAIDRRREPPRLNLREVATGEVEVLVGTGQADLGLCHMARATTGAQVEAIGSDGLAIVGTPTLLARVTTPEDLSPLRGARLLAWPRSNHPEYFDLLVGTCHERGLDPEVVDGADRFSGARRYLLTSGEAIALVPQDATTALNTGLTSLSLSGTAVPLCAVTQSRARRTTAEVVRMARSIAERGARTPREAHSQAADSC